MLQAEALDIFSTFALFLLSRNIFNKADSSQSH